MRECGSLDQSKSERRTARLAQQTMLQSTWDESKLSEIEHRHCLQAEAEMSERQWRERFSAIQARIERDSKDEAAAVSELEDAKLKGGDDEVTLALEAHLKEVREGNFIIAAFEFCIF